MGDYQRAIGQSARYAKSLGLSEIWMVVFVEIIDDDNRQQLEKPQLEVETSVTIHPVFVITN